MGESGGSWLWRLTVAGGLVALALLALSPLMVRVSEAPSAPGVVLAAAECEITGLSEYSILESQSGACSPSIYVRACRDAQQQHRDRCQEFCGALKELGGRQFCVGSSSPVAQLFDPGSHCRELRHEYFEVSCRVSAICSCRTAAPSTAG